jgi:hypothetical protein
MPTQQPTANRAVEAVGEPTGALPGWQPWRRTKKPRFLAGLFLSEPPRLAKPTAWLDVLATGLSAFWARVSERPESSGWLAGPQLVDDDERITLCPASAGLFLALHRASLGTQHSGCRFTYRPCSQL